MRLLLPTVRNPASQSIRSTQAPHVASDVALHWLGEPLQFAIVGEHIQLDGFQLYAVEKWIVERRRPVTVLAVYTGDPSHKITVTCLSPPASLTPAEAKAEWDKACHLLKRDGAKPKETPHGIIMATSLANFRSDFTIVRVPGGNFLSIREHLYANINLLRMGCGGRSALTLEDPSDSTRDRFTTTYHLPDSNYLAAHPEWESPSTTDIAADPSLAKSHAKSLAKPLFFSTVLELVKLVQACLFIFGMFTNPALRVGYALDGLLCDITIEGIQQWIRDIGEPCLGVEPTERIADPTIIASMLSLVLSVRNKLSALGYTHIMVPKDPFIHPQAFIFAVSQCLSHISAGGTSPSKQASPQHTPHFSFNSSSWVNSHSSSSLPHKAQGPDIYLTRGLVENISAAYDKARHSESKKVHRVLFNKLDFTNVSDEEAKDVADSPSNAASADAVVPGSTGAQILSGLGSLTSGLRLATSSAAGAAAAVVDPTTDLEAFVNQVVGKHKAKKIRAKSKSKDWSDPVDGRELGAAFSMDPADSNVGGVAGSVRGLWTGRVTGVIKLRQRELGTPDNPSRKGSNDVERERTWKKSLRGTISDGDAEDRYGTDEDSDFSGGGTLGRPWSGRMHKKIDAWTARARKKPHQSIDLSPRNGSTSRHTLKGLGLPSSSSAMQSMASSAYTLSPRIQASEYPTEEEGLSSGQISPIDETKPLNPLSLVPSEYEKRVLEFAQKRPWGNRLSQSRVTSWSDPVSARVDGDDESGLSRGKGKKRPNRLVTAMLTDESASLSGGTEDIQTSEALPLQFASQRSSKRRRSFTDFSSYRHMDVLSPERMKIDVELCSHLLVMARREAHLNNVLQCLEVFTSQLSQVNDFVLQDHERNLEQLSEIDRRSKVMDDIDAERLNCDLTQRELDALKYESTLFRVSDLWHTVNPQRQKVLLIRDKVFGMGSRQLAPGVKGAHGEFNRQQWRLDGETKLVDHLGRTESEAEEDSDHGHVVSTSTEEHKAIVVENPSVKPIWLLRLFTSWGARWSTAASSRSDGELKVDPSVAHVASPS